MDCTRDTKRQKTTPATTISSRYKDQTSDAVGLTLDHLSDEILQTILSFLLNNPDNPDLTFWPWILHVDPRQGGGGGQDKVWRPFRRVQQNWKSYCILCSVDKRWRVVADKVVEDMRMETLKSVLEVSDQQEYGWDHLELIYQPRGHALPEFLSVSERPWTTLPVGEHLIPPQGLLFLKSARRYHACAELFYETTPPNDNTPPSHIHQSARWDAFIPPRTMDHDDVGVIRIINQFIDEAPVHLRKRRGTNNFCVKKEGSSDQQPFVMLDNETIEVPTNQVELPRIMSSFYGLNPKERLLISAKRQGEDRCLKFFRKFLLSTNENSNA